MSTVLNLCQPAEEDNDYDMRDHSHCDTRLNGGRIPWILKAFV